MRRDLVISVLVLLSALTAADAAMACSCGGRPNVLESYEGSKNVVVLTATGVQKAPDGIHSVDGVIATTMRVDKVYKGRLKPADVITFAQGGGADCIWTFSENSIGKSFLFYLDDRGPDSRWIGFGCGRSNILENAGEDLLFLDKLDKVRGKTRISGEISFATSGEMASPTVEGINLTITGAGRRQKLKTDKNGVYEIYGLPPGVYRIDPEVPRGWKVDSFYLTYASDLIVDRDDEGEPKADSPYVVRLEDKKHASLDFHFEINNALRGRIYDPQGNLMRGVCVRLFPPTGIDKNFMYNADCTEEDGRFELDEVPPGNYIIVANDENEISSSEPFRTLYYPGVFDLDKATILSIGLGEFREGLDIRIPWTEDTVMIEGSFLWSDGKPVIDELVTFAPADAAPGIDGRAVARTDESGKFSLRVLKGMKGKIFGSMWAYIGEFAKCPKLETFIRSVSGRTSTDVASTPLPVEADQNLSGVDLRLPFPGCKKSKD